MSHIVDILFQNPILENIVYINLLERPHIKEGNGGQNLNSV
jgi:hypothetical protein